MGHWTVTPETVKHEGEYRGQAFWVKLKKQLTAGESLRMQSAGFRGYKQPEESAKEESIGLSNIDVDFSRVKICRVVTYVVDWSLDENDKKLVVSDEVVESMPLEFVDMLNDLINDQEDSMDEEKKDQSGESA